MGSDYTLEQEKAALAIQCAARQKQAREQVRHKRVQREKKIKKQSAEEQARLRILGGKEAYTDEHEDAAVVIQCAERSKLARNKVKKKKHEKGSIGGIGGLAC